ncbi:MAG TPA: cyclic nucleotide-binding domain-containing protein [Xanthobacteraceae bacterium]
MDFSITTIVGFIAAGLVIATLSMRTMVPLRVTGIASNFAFITYGFMFGSVPTIVLHAILFPLNVYRLSEMLKLIKQVKAASAGDLSMDWIKPFMSKRAIKAGEILFRKGDEANHMYFVVSGKLRLHEIHIEVPPGAVVGELGMLAPNRKRTQTLECTDGGSVLEIDYEKIEQLYYQNPTFGFYFLRLSSARLFENIGRLERLLAERDAELDRLRAEPAQARS